MRQCFHDSDYPIDVKEPILPQHDGLQWNHLIRIFLNTVSANSIEYSKNREDKKVLCAIPEKMLSDSFETIEHSGMLEIAIELLSFQVRKLYCRFTLNFFGTMLTSEKTKHEAVLLFWPRAKSARAHIS